MPRQAIDTRPSWSIPPAEQVGSRSTLGAAPVRQAGSRRPPANVGLVAKQAASSSKLDSATRLQDLSPPPANRKVSRPSRLQRVLRSSEPRSRCQTDRIIQQAGVSALSTGLAFTVRRTGKQKLVPSATGSLSMNVKLVTRPSTSSSKPVLHLAHRACCHPPANR
jgi:hypothetical protein